LENLKIYFIDKLLICSQITYPLCTIASTPRLPEHCIEYVKLIQWPKENPFDSNIDTDDPAHISWIYEKSLERSDEFGIHLDCCILNNF
jgi:ubiquitin-activating enzyme E1 C